MPSAAATEQYPARCRGLQGNSGAPYARQQDRPANGDGSTAGMASAASLVARHQRQQRWTGRPLLSPSAASLGTSTIASATPRGQRMSSASADLMADRRACDQCATAPW